MQQALKRFALFSQNQKFEDAVEAYTKAGNCFKARHVVVPRPPCTSVCPNPPLHP